MIRVSRLMCLVWLACLVPALDAWAGPVRLATGDGMSPHTGKDLSHYGMLTEIVQRSFQLAGHDTTLDWAPWKRGYELAKLGEYDATFPYARSPEREQEYLYSDRLYGGIRAVYARPGNTIDPARPETFRGAYCAPPGYLIYSQIETQVANGAVRLRRPSSLVTCAKMLALGRVDFFIADATSGDEALKQAGVGRSVVRLAKPFDKAEFYLIVPRNRSDAQTLIGEFNAGLKRLKASGEYAHIVARHLH